MEQLIEAYNVRLFKKITTFHLSIINRHVDMVYMIHLEDDTLRRKYIEIMMKKLNINYRTVIVEKPSSNIYHGLLRLANPRIKKMTVGEVGCYMSHMWCLQDIMKNKYKNAIIFEDDIVAHTQLETLYENIVAKKDWDFLVLGAADHGFTRGNSELVKDNIYIPKHHAILGTHSIYYSLHGAEVMYNHRKKNPVYFDRNLKEVFQLFDKEKTGVCCPNLFTVENSTSHLNHHFGIVKHETNDYYYDICYKNFDFKDYHMIYLDLFKKYILESEDEWLILHPREIVKKLLINYFNNDKILVELHYKKLDVEFFTNSDYIKLLQASQNRIITEYYKDCKQKLCEKHNVTSGILIKKNIKRTETKISNLFYKQHLDSSIKLSKLRYKISHIVKQQKKYVAHLHCFDLNDFIKIYEKYFDKIKKYNDIVVTYCNDIKTYDKKLSKMLFSCCVLQCENKGMDIGGKFVMINFIKQTKKDYSYILFLHSKNCEKTRELYFDSLLQYIPYDSDVLQQETIGGFFPPTIHTGRDSSIVYNHRYLEDGTLKKNLYYPFKFNSRYVNEFIKYFDLPKNDITLFPSGNCYCLHRDIAERLFTDVAIYNCLNHKTYKTKQDAVQCFDYNWVKLYYNIPFEDIEFAYEMCKKLKYKGNFLQIQDRNKQFRNGMVEHAFERLVFPMVFNTKNKYNNTYEIEILLNKENKNTDKIRNLSKEINQCYKFRILYKDFDAESYLQKNKDLVKNNIKTKDQAWRHWTSYGWHENREI